MLVFHLDKERCKKDGICKKVCPLNIIRLDKEGLPYMLEGGSERCMTCGQCIAYCPHQACRLEGLPSPEILPIKRTLLPSEEQALELCKSRRSVRHFTQEDVAQDTLLAIMEGVRYAPTAKNRQSQRWIIINSADTLKKLGDQMADAMEQKAEENPEGALLAAAWRKGMDPYFRGARQLLVAVMPKSWVFAVTDAAIALTYFEILAHAHGVGCCWAGYFTTLARQYEPMANVLGLNQDEMVGGAQMFGYPLIKASAIPPRKPLHLTLI